ncbi:hypothetical protein L2E82_26994 [Cichorium intybus]|uniref:Uncharacterized protein n=1 Tax=Cichorium intybus TaxID=13427 RepID=A0ACB9CRS0_CICIN|nr:hypothetical protein L2E82_26994 [Cichorium intybus]
MLSNFLLSLLKLQIIILLCYYTDKHENKSRVSSAQLIRLKDKQGLPNIDVSAFRSKVSKLATQAKRERKVKKFYLKKGDQDRVSVGVASVGSSIAREVIFYSI